MIILLLLVFIFYKLLLFMKIV